jgi:Ca2+/Na+ antiporter
MSSSGDSEWKLFTYLCIGVVLGIVGFFRGFQLRKKKKLIEDIPTSTVRGMAVGLTEVKGKARDFQKLLVSAFAKVPCVYFYYNVQEYRSSGKSGHWVTIAEYASPELFYLEDETGKTLVNPQGAEFHAHPDRRYGGSYNSTDFVSKDKEILFGQLAVMNISTKGAFGFDRQLRCSETYIEPGDNLYVIGTAQPNPICSGSAVGSENLCIGAQSGNVFLISDEDEKHVLSEFNNKMYLYLYGGPILTVVCLFILIGHYFKSMF